MAQNTHFGNELALSDELVQELPSKLTTHHTKLSRADLQTLSRKQQWLRSYTPAFPNSDRQTPAPFLQNALRATLVFAQDEAGTAVCISPEGLILTCSHCVAEEEAELQLSRTSWLIFASGQVVKTECVAWDNKRDLALCRIVAAESRTHSSAVSSASTLAMFPSLPFAKVMPRVTSPLMCVGHPGSDDLESVVPGTKTNYDTLYISYGRYRGYFPGQDIHDNEDIGALRHDCWTYWGHSGAPLIEMKTGQLIGLHSSWDDTTGMRRGVGLEAVQSFLQENLPRLGNVAGAKALLEQL